MSRVSTTTTVEVQLADVGKRLTESSNSKDALFKVLKQAATLFSEVDQAPPPNVLSAMQPSMDALVQPGLLRHKDKDVRVLVATCISEIMRIVAPDAPYSDEVLKEIFELIVATFQGLNEISSPYFARRVSILETVAKVRSCVVMLDLECDDLIHEMFQTFFLTASEDPQNVLIGMRSIMCLVLEESEYVPQPLLDMLFSNLLKEKKGGSSAAHQLAMAVFQRCAEKLEPYVQRFLTSVMLEGKSSQSRLREDYHEIIYEIYRCAPQMLLAVIPKLTEELLTDQLDVRLSAVKLLGRLFSLPGQHVLHEFKQLFAEFLKRFTDKAVEVRLAVVECAKQCLLANPSGPEAEEILTALNDRLQDYDNEVRTHVVTSLCDLAKSNPKVVPMDIMKRVAERLRDKEIFVRRETLQRLTEVYRTFCLKSFEGSTISDESFSWIPSKIIRCCFDKDCKEFRPQAIELVFSDELFPSELPVEERVKYWISFFSAFDKNDVKALERVLLQKQRLQHEMQNYLSLRQKLKEEDSLENQKKLQSCCKGMLASFVDPAKAEEHFQRLNQLKDSNILKALMGLLDPNTTLSQSQAVRDDLLRRLGEKHPQHEFIKILATKCSYILFGKEHLKALLTQIVESRASGKEEMLGASMGLLVEFASHFPALVEGAEEDLLQLLKEDNELIKEGVVQILAKAGGSIRGQWTEGSGSVDLVLEKLCIEGSRKQAKYAVQALAAITSDSGLKALSALYRKLVDLLETSAHLPTVLQSLGCIAKTAMSVFETREDELVQFVVRDLFRRDSTHVDVGKTDWHDASEVCLLKICGLKTLVNSFLPNKDAHQRQRIKGVFGILAKVLECGEIADEVKTSEIDKAHLRLAAAKGVLRLSRRWDTQISHQLFHSTVLVAQDFSAHVRRLFLGKVHQFLKERAIPHKYACAFPLSISDATEELLAEAKQYIGDFVETSRREARLRQAAVSGQSDASLITYYPEYILFYLVHVLAQGALFPSLSDGGPSSEAIEPFFKQLSFFIWALVNQDGEGRNDGNKKEDPGNVAVILAIFHTMKHAEDAVDISKTENTYILCDMGILITKDMARNQLPSASNVGNIPLPLSLYKASEVMEEASEGMKEATQKEDGSHLPACLEDADVIAQFKASMPLQVGLASSPDQKRGKRTVDDGSSSEEDVEPSKKRSRTNEILEGPTEQEAGVIQKAPAVTETKPSHGRKRAQKEKAARTVETVTKLTETGAAGTPDQVTPSSPKRKRGRSSKENGELLSPELKRGRSDETLSGMLSERRKRGRPKVANRKDESVKDETLDSDMPTVDMESKDEKETKNTSGEAVPVTPGSVLEEKPKSDEGSSKRPARISVKKLKPRQEAVVESPLERQHPGQQEAGLPESAEGTKRESRRSRKNLEGLQDSVEKPEAEAAKSPRETPRRSAKKISISGLESPDSKADNKDKAANEKLVGCRIKVWWPMDKQFYEGLIASYDPLKKRHKVVYSDGDIEILNLAKERWEFLEGDDKSSPEGRPGSPSTPSASQQSPQPKRKSNSVIKAHVKGDLKGESPHKRVASSPKTRKDSSSIAKSDGANSPAKISETDQGDPFDFSEDVDVLDKARRKEESDRGQITNTETKGTQKARRRSATVKAEKKASSQSPGKGAKSTVPLSDDGVEGKSSPSASKDSKDSDDVPLDAWKSRTRKVH